MKKYSNVILKESREIKSSIIDPISGQAKETVRFVNILIAKDAKPEIVQRTNDKGTFAVFEVPTAVLHSSMRLEADMDLSGQVELVLNEELKRYEVIPVVK